MTKLAILAVALNICACAPKRSTVQLPAGSYPLSEFVATEGAAPKTEKRIADTSLTLTVSEQTVTLRQNDDTIVSAQLEKLPAADSYEGCPRMGAVDISATYRLTNDFRWGGVSFDSAVIYRACTNGPIEVTLKNTEDDLNPRRCSIGPCLVFSVD